MKILTDHFLFFWDISRDMPPKVRSKRHLERFSSVSARIRAPMRGHRRFLPIMAISPTFRPATTPPHDTTRERHHAIRTRKRSADISLNAMVKEEHCDRNSLLSVDTDDVAAHGAQSAQDGPQRLNNQQKQKVVGKNLNLVLLTSLVCVDNLTSRERGRKVGTGTIPSSPRMCKGPALVHVNLRK